MGGEARKGQQGFVPKSKVVAEFVEEIPAPDPNANFKGRRISWQPQEGVRAALDLAFQNPRRAMLLVEYDQGAPSKRRSMATLRVRALNEQGYNGKNGWIVKAVENKVYVSYTGVVYEEDEGDIW